MATLISLLVPSGLAQTEWLNPPPSLVLEGVPSIPAVLAESADRYRASSPDVLVGWDPVKLEPTFVRRHSAGPWLVSTVTTPGGQPSRICPMPPRGYEAYSNPQKGYFVFEADASSGAERMQLFRWDLERRSVFLLTDGKSTNGSPVFSNSGEMMMYSSNRRDGKHLDVYVVSPLNPARDRMVAQTDGEGWTVLDWSPDDRKVILSEYRSSDDSDLWILDVATGKRSRLTAPPASGKMFNGSCAQFSSDAKGVYVITDRESDFLRLAYLDIATKRYTYLTGVNWNVEELSLSPDRRLLAFTTNENGFSRLHILDTGEKNKEIALPEVPSGVIERLRWHNSGTHLAFGFSSGTVPGDIYSVEVKARKVQQWTSSARVVPEEAPQPELIKWKSFDGKLIPGFLYRPQGKAASRRAVIIDVHGGPNDQFRPSFRGTDNYFTLELGAVMIHPNIRGSTGYGKTYLELDNGYLRQDSIKDIGALLNWIKEQPDLDADRVLIKGESYGGYVALSVAANFSDQILGAISDSGPSSLVTHLERTDVSRQDRRRAEYGDERNPHMREFLESIAPLNRAAKVKKPLLVLQGRNDTRVVFSESEQMVAAVRKNGTPVWYVLATNEGHGLTSPANQRFWISVQALFARKLFDGEPITH